MQPLDAQTRETLFALYREKNLKKLIDRIDSLLEQHPHELVLPSLMGAAHLELGEYASAIRYYQQALRLKPDFDKLLNSLGICYLRLGRIDEAGETFQRALAQNPDFAPACFNLGLVHEKLDAWEQAIESYKRAIKLDQQHFEAYTSLGIALWRTGEFSGVSEAFTRALQCKPDHIPAHRNLLDFLTRTNQHNQLKEQFEFASQYLQDHYLYFLYQGVLADIDGEHESARQLLESVRIDTTDEALLYDERHRLSRLTRLCDQLGDSESAIKYAQQGNELSEKLADQAGIKKETFISYIENREATFSERYSEKGVFDYQASTITGPVFVVGFPRSGTTLLDTILRGHPRVSIAEESDAVPRLINELSGKEDEHLESLATLSTDKITRLRQFYTDAVIEGLEVDSSKKLVIDRFAINIIYAGEIHRIFPEARFVLVLRHPADCVLSCYMQTFIETPLNANFFSLQDAANVYSRVFALWKRYTEKLDLNMHVVKYEELVSDTESCCRHLLDFLNLDWNSNILDHKKTASQRSMIKTVSYNQVTQNLYKDAIGRWRRYSEHLAPVMDVLEPWVREFDYEL